MSELVARQLNLPTVLRFHGLGSGGLRRRLESKLARAATWVSASCTGEASELIRMGRPRSGTSVIPCGVDVDGDLESDREARRLRELAEQLGVADRLRLHRAAIGADMPALPLSADVVACTPSYESSGVVALQAMACDRTLARDTWDRIATDTVRLYEKSISVCCGEPTAVAV